MDLKRSSALTGTDELRFVTQSAAGLNFAFIVGETWLIKAADRHAVPDALLSNSEPVAIEQRTPYTRVFDAAWFATMTKPRPEPEPIRRFTAEEICQEKFPHWTPDAVQRAIATAGFPKANGYRSIGTVPEIWGEGQVSIPTWSEDAIDRWSQANRELGLGL
jgi:hypothetical protein